MNSEHAFGEQDNLPQNHNVLLNLNNFAESTNLKTYGDKTLKSQVGAGFKSL